MKFHINFCVLTTQYSICATQKSEICSTPCDTVFETVQMAVDMRIHFRFWPSSPDTLHRTCRAGLGMRSYGVNKFLFPWISLSVTPRVGADTAGSYPRSGSVITWLHRIPNDSKQGYPWRIEWNCSITSSKRSAWVSGYCGGSTPRTR